MMARLASPRRISSLFRWMGASVAVYDLSIPNESGTEGGNLRRSVRRKRGRRSKRGGRRRALASADSLPPPWENLWGGRRAWAFRAVVTPILLEEWNSDLQWTRRTARTVADQLSRQDAEVERILSGQPPAYHAGDVYDATMRKTMRFQKFVRTSAGRMFDVQKKLEKLRAGISPADFRSGLRPVVQGYRKLKERHNLHIQRVTQAIHNRSGIPMDAARTVLQSYIHDFEGRDLWSEYYGATRQELDQELLDDANAELRDPLGYAAWNSEPPPLYGSSNDRFGSRVFVTGNSRRDNGTNIGRSRGFTTTGGRRGRRFR